MIQRKPIQLHKRAVKNVTETYEGGGDFQATKITQQARFFSQEIPSDNQLNSDILAHRVSLPDDQQIAAVGMQTQAADLQRRNDFMRIPAPWQKEELMTESLESRAKPDSKRHPNKTLQSFLTGSFYSKHSKNQNSNPNATITDRNTTSPFNSANQSQQMKNKAKSPTIIFKGQSSLAESPQLQNSYKKQLSFQFDPQSAQNAQKNKQQYSESKYRGSPLSRQIATQLSNVGNNFLKSGALLLQPAIQKQSRIHGISISPRRKDGKNFKLKQKRGVFSDEKSEKIDYKSTFKVSPKKQQSPLALYETNSIKSLEKDNISLNIDQDAAPTNETVEVQKQPMISSPPKKTAAQNSPSTRYKQFSKSPKMQSKGVSTSQESIQQLNQHHLKVKIPNFKIGTNQSANYNKQSHELRINQRVQRPANIYEKSQRQQQMAFLNEKLNQEQKQVGILGGILTVEPLFGENRPNNSNFINQDSNQNKKNLQMQQQDKSSVIDDQNIMNNGDENGLLSITNILHSPQSRSAMNPSPATTQHHEAQSSQFRNTQMNHRRGGIEENSLQTITDYDNKNSQDRMGGGNVVHHQGEQKSQQGANRSRWTARESDSRVSRLEGLQQMNNLQSILSQDEELKVAMNSHKDSLKPKKIMSTLSALQWFQTGQNLQSHHQTPFADERDEQYNNTITDQTNCKKEKVNGFDVPMRQTGEKKGGVAMAVAGVRTTRQHKNYKADLIIKSPTFPNESSELIQEQVPSQLPFQKNSGCVQTHYGSKRGGLDLMSQQHQHQNQQMLGVTQNNPFLEEFSPTLGSSTSSGRRIINLTALKNQQKYPQYDKSNHANTNASANRGTMPQNKNQFQQKSLRVSLKNEGASGGALTDNESGDTIEQTSRMQEIQVFGEQQNGVGRRNIVPPNATWKDQEDQDLPEQSIDRNQTEKESQSVENNQHSLLQKSGNEKDNEEDCNDAFEDSVVLIGESDQNQNRTTSNYLQEVENHHQGSSKNNDKSSFKEQMYRRSKKTESTVTVTTLNKEGQFTPKFIQKSGQNISNGAASFPMDYSVRVSATNRYPQNVQHKQQKFQHQQQGSNKLSIKNQTMTSAKEVDGGGVITMEKVVGANNSGWKSLNTDLFEYKLNKRVKNSGKSKQKINVGDKVVGVVGSSVLANSKNNPQNSGYSIRDSSQVVDNQNSKEKVSQNKLNDNSQTITPLQSQININNDSIKNLQRSVQKNEEITSIPVTLKQINLSQPNQVQKQQNNLPANNLLPLLVQNGQDLQNSSSHYSTMINGLLKSHHKINQNQNYTKNIDNQVVHNDSQQQKFHPGTTPKLINQILPVFSDDETLHETQNPAQPLNMLSKDQTLTHSFDHDFDPKLIRQELIDFQNQLWLQNNELKIANENSSSMNENGIEKDQIQNWQLENNKNFVFSQANDLLVQKSKINKLMKVGDKKSTLIHRKEFQLPQDISNRINLRNSIQPKTLTNLTLKKQNANVLRNSELSFTSAKNRTNNSQISKQMFSTLDLDNKRQGSKQYQSINQWQFQSNYTSRTPQKQKIISSEFQETNLGQFAISKQISNPLALSKPLHNPSHSKRKYLGNQTISPRIRPDWKKCACTEGTLRNKQPIREGRGKSFGYINQASIQDMESILRLINEEKVQSRSIDGSFTTRDGVGGSKGQQMLQHLGGGNSLRKLMRGSAEFNQKMPFGENIKSKQGGLFSVAINKNDQSVADLTINDFNYKRMQFQNKALGESRPIFKTVTEEYMNEQMRGGIDSNLEQNHALATDLYSHAMQKNLVLGKTEAYDLSESPILYQNDRQLEQQMYRNKNPMQETYLGFPTNKSQIVSTSQANQAPLQHIQYPV